MAASPKEYREFAQDCLRWGAETKSDSTLMSRLAACIADVIPMAVRKRL